MSPRAGPYQANRDYGVPADDEQEWGPVVPLDGGWAAEPFPVQVLPPWLGDMVSAVAAATATPPDLAGIVALGVLSTICGGLVEIEVQAGYREGSNLFVAGVMDPGERKSGVMGQMTDCLHTHEDELEESTREERMLATQHLRIAEHRRNRAEKKAAGTDDSAGSEEDAANAAREMEEIKVPPEPRLFTDDVTSEALSGLIRTGSDGDSGPWNQAAVGTSDPRA